MTYLTRLLLLASAAFFIVQLVVEALVSLIARAAIRRAGTMRPQGAARFLLTLRLLPAGFSIIVVALLCVPSYLRFEPRLAQEEVGFLCVAAALLGAISCAASIARATAAVIRSARYAQRSEGLALSGILRPRLLISERALVELSPDQLAVALRHEMAHLASRDNLKRLLILLAPSIFSPLRLLERAWAKCAEWAADDQAAGGDAHRCAALAEALVRVARLQGGVPMPPLVTSLVEADEDLSSRVNRLLEPPVYKSNRHIGTIAMSGAALLIFSAAMNPGALRIVHRLLERLLD